MIEDRHDEDSDPGTLTDRGLLAMQSRDFAKAASLLQAALGAGDDRPIVHANLGWALLVNKQFTSARAALERAVELDPQDFRTECNLGAALLKLGEYKAAEAHFRQSFAGRPDFWQGHHGVASALQMLGKADEAIFHLRRALEIEPSRREVHDSLIFMLELSPSSTLEELQLERRSWYEKFARGAPRATAYPNRRDPKRPLRIGYVSPDFRIHSAATCFGAVIRYRNREQYEAYCYSGSRAEDIMTDAIRRSVDAWRSTVDVPDDELAAQIKQDGIDILVDLTGHTAGHRLLVFARKPAPLQVTAWGFATGTGLPTIDYMFSDAISIPPEQRPLFVERIVDLPCVICYEAPGDAPPVSALPSLNGEPFTFGCINRTEKISDPTVALWARILNTMPEARLLLKSIQLQSASVRDAICARFFRHGIGQQRLLLLGNTDMYNHFAALHRVDLALDPFPANGGITTAETLWMGVPVVTMQGSTPHGRNSAAILTAAGMPDWIARDEPEYVCIALEFADDPWHLARLRSEMRARLLATEVFDTRRYTRRVEAAYRTMWRRWCDQGA